MSNPLFQMIGNNAGNGNDMIRRFEEFRRTFTGDPRQQVQNLLNSGRVNQEQYNRAVQMANARSKIIR